MASSVSSLEVTATAMARPAAQEKQEPWEYILRKYVLMLAMLVATVTYGVGFNPPGGVWQDNVDGHVAGESIVRTTNNLRYLVFFYCNTAALASSVLVIVLFLLLSIEMVEEKDVSTRLKLLRLLMVLDLLSFMGAYAAGSCRDTLTTVYTSVLMAAAVLAYLTVQLVLASCPESSNKDEISGCYFEHEVRLRKVLMLLSTFATSITYAAGLNSPGGFWDNTAGGGHLLGKAILNDGPHKARLATFFICNTTAFMASLLIIILLLGKKLHERTVRSREMYGCILVALVGLVGAYAAGSCREATATTYVPLVVLAILLWILFWRMLQPAGWIYCRPTYFSQRWMTCVTMLLRRCTVPSAGHPGRKQSRSILLLLTTFATAITYQAGLDPPGGVWQDSSDVHIAGDPILLTTNASRYKIFLYCNSFAFVASLVTVKLFVLELLERIHMVESLMILQLFALIIAYAAGACRDVSTSIYVTALGGVVLLYVVIHVIFFTLEQDRIDFYVEQAEVEMKRKLLYLLATLSMAMSYQAGLTPPGGFWLQDDKEFGQHAGAPVLLYNNPSHYKAFFYCNSVSFMLSITTMILLVSPALYRPAIRSYALTICTVAGLSCLMGAYAAAGSTQEYLATSIGLFVLVALAFFILVVLLIIFLIRDRRATLRRSEAHEEVPMINTQEGELISPNEMEELKSKYQIQLRKHHMLLVILLAGVTYQAGLEPPGGVWQSDDGHSAGGPVMLDNRRLCYLAFFYSNSTSFAASIVAITLLSLQWLSQRIRLSRRVMHMFILLSLLALLVAYVAGSTHGYWRLLVYVASLAILVFAFIIIKLIIYLLLMAPQPSYMVEVLEV